MQGTIGKGGTEDIKSELARTSAYVQLRTETKGEERIGTKLPGGDRA